MVDLKSSLEMLNWARELSAGSPELPTAWLDPFWTAAIAVVIGFILAFWGGRVLRVGFVFAFMAAGAVAGKHFASSIQIDLLIGLVCGAGLAGAIGYVVYRWCLGVTVAVVAGLIVAATFSAPALLNERQAFDDFRLGVGTGQYSTVGTPLYSWTAVRSYFWEQPRGRDVVYRSLGPVVLTALVGFVASILAPRFASMLATSVLGTMCLAGGSAALIGMKWPDSWTSMQAHRGWVLGATLCLWLFSLMYQSTHPARPVLQTPVAPAAPAPTA